MMSGKVDFILAREFTKIETYEDCPCDVDLVVWTGGRWATEMVTRCGDNNSPHPAHGIEFTHYASLPYGEDLED